MTRFTLLKGRAAGATNEIIPWYAIHGARVVREYARKGASSRGGLSSQAPGIQLHPPLDASVPLKMPLTYELETVRLNHRAILHSELEYLSRDCYPDRWALTLITDGIVGTRKWRADSTCGPTVLLLLLLQICGPN